MEWCLFRQVTGNSNGWVNYLVVTKKPHRHIRVAFSSGRDSLAQSRDQKVLEAFGIQDAVIAACRADYESRS